MDTVPLEAGDEIRRGLVPDWLIASYFFLPDMQIFWIQLQGDETLLRRIALPNDKDQGAPFRNAPGITCHTIVLLGRFVQKIIVG